MSELDLKELTTLLDDHFTFAPPLDNPGIQKVNGRKVGYVPSANNILDYGEGFNISGGYSLVALRGIKNIQVFEPGHSKPVSLQTRIQNLVNQNKSPGVITADLNVLLKGGHLSYFEQGREFATRLQIDADNKLHTSPINPQAPECKKPRRTAWQVLKYITGQFKGRERAEYDKKMAVYEMHKQSLAVSHVRATASKNSYAFHPKQPDGKGRICINDDLDVGKKVEKGITTRREDAQLPDEERRIKVYNNILKSNHDDHYKVGVRSSLETLTQQRAERLAEQERQIQRAKDEAQRAKEEAQRELLKPFYNGDVPKNIKSMEDHIQSKIALQHTLPKTAHLEEMKGNLRFQSAFFVIGNALRDSLFYTSPHYKKDTPESLKVIGAMDRLVSNSTAFKEIMTYSEKREKGINPNDPRDALHVGIYQKLYDNKIFDYFVDVITKYPIQGLSQESCKGLLNLCIDAHPAFQAAAYAPIPKEHEKIAQNANQPLANQQQNVGANSVRPKEIKAKANQQPKPNQQQKQKPNPIGR